LLITFWGRVSNFHKITAGIKQFTNLLKHYGKDKNISY
jgi:hypothetical protein